MRECWMVEAASAAVRHAFSIDFLFFSIEGRSREGTRASLHPRSAPTPSSSTGRGDSRAPLVTKGVGSVLPLTPGLLAEPAPGAR